MDGISSVQLLAEMQIMERFFRIKSGHKKVIAVIVDYASNYAESMNGCLVEQLLCMTVLQNFSQIWCGQILLSQCPVTEKENINSSRLIESRTM